MDNSTIPIEMITGTIENTIKGCNITLLCTSEGTAKVMHSMTATTLPSSLSLLTIVICVAIGIYKYHTAIPEERKHGTDVERQQPGFTYGASGIAAVSNISFPENIYMRERDNLRRIDTGDPEIPTYTASAGSREYIVYIDPQAYGVDLPGCSTET